MQEQINNIEQRMSELESRVATLIELVQQNTESSYRTAKRDIINHEVQFKQKVYRADGTRVTQIN